MSNVTWEIVSKVRCRCIKPLRDGLKTQPPVDRRFRPVAIVLNNGNRSEPDETAGQPAVEF